MKKEMLGKLELDVIRAWIENAPKKASLSMLVITISGL